MHLSYHTDCQTTRHREYFKWQRRCLHDMQYCVRMATTSTLINKYLCLHSGACPPLPELKPLPPTQPLWSTICIASLLMSTVHDAMPAPLAPAATLQLDGPTPML